MKNNRDFKGVWIPKAIWITKELTIMEKLFLVEIDSLDNKDGCFAGNSHFVDMFDLSKQRCSQVINSLATKKYINIDLIYEGKQIRKRVIRVSNIIDRGVKFSRGGCQEKLIVSNTVKNTVNTLESAEAFDEFWKNYPKKDGRKPALTAFNKLSKENQIKATNDCKTRYVGTIRQYIKNPSTYLNQETWEDERMNDAPTATFKNVL